MDFLFAKKSSRDMTVRFGQNPKSAKAAPSALHSQRQILPQITSLRTNTLSPKIRLKINYEKLKERLLIQQVKMAKKILVVDDEPDIRKLTSLRLKLSGYEAITAVDGKDALDSIRQQKPDLVLLDLLLPVIDGFEVCKKIKADEELKQIPVILFTARSDTMTVEKAKQLGASDYMTKPFNPEEMLNKIKQALESKAEVSNPH